MTKSTTRLTATLIELRAVIAAGGPTDDNAARRLALRATSFITDPDKAERLHEHVLAHLLFQIVARSLDENGTAAFGDWEQIVDAIEAASRPN